MLYFKYITGNVKKLDNDILNLYTPAVIELMSKGVTPGPTRFPRQLGKAREEFLL